MKILAINGSRRKKGNTASLVESILAPAQAAGVQTETIFLGDYDIGACTGCEACAKSWDCVIKDDFAGIVEKLDEADGIVLASPTYWYSVTSDMKRFIDRCYSIIQFPVSRREWISKYEGAGKVCVAAAVCEQPDAAMMGNTLTLLNDFSKDIGLDVIATVTGLELFEAGSIRSDTELLRTAEAVGKELLDALR